MKEVLWLCYENLINVLQSFILVESIAYIFGVRYWKKRPYITKIIGTVPYALALIASNYIVGFEGFGIIGFCGLLSLFGILMLEGKWYSKIIVVLLQTLITIFISATVSISVCLVADIDGTELAYKMGLERFIALLLVQALLAGCLRAAGNILKRQWSPLTFSKNEGKIFILVFFISLVVFFCITQTVFTQELSSSNKSRMLYSCAGLILLNVICFQMLNDLMKKREIETENLLLKEQALYQEQYAKEVKQQYDEMKRLRHDLKQQYSVLENLLMQGKYGLMENYLLRAMQGINSRESVVYIKNEYVNAILNRKISHAKELGIEVLLKTVEEFIGINEMDLCNLLGNLLDNAREACQQVIGRKSIELNLSQDSNKIYVEIKNSIKESVLKKNRDLKTHKDDGREHGYGMKTVRKIMEKYGGLMDLWEEGEKFCVGIVLYIEK